MNTIDRFFDIASERTHKRFWLLSDLQQYDPARAEKYFQTALRDFRGLALKIDGICYLGDAAEGIDEKAVESMIAMQVAGLESFGVPVYYVMGNHEFDLYRKQMGDGPGPHRVPFYEAVHGRPLWHSIPTLDSFWFAEDAGEFAMLFFSDHAGRNGEWLAYHQFLPQAGEGYPYTADDWRRVRDRFAAIGKPVFTFAHCAFPGGNRPSQFLEQLLPLPPNFRAHFHGHAHIGDADWAKQDLYRKIACVNDQPIEQYDIASLDHLRGTAVRSAIFDYFGDGEYSVFWRDHSNARWENCDLVRQNPREAGIPEKFARA